MLNRKGQIQTIPSSVIALSVAAIALVLLIVISQEVIETDIVRKSQSGNVTNETLSAAITENGVVLGAGASSPGCIATIEYAVNESSIMSAIPAGNYSVSDCTISYAGDTAQAVNNTIWNVTYSYTWGDTAYGAGNQTVSGLGTFGDFWTIIVLAIIAAVVIGIIFSIFGRPGRR